MPPARDCDFKGNDMNRFAWGAGAALAAALALDAHASCGAAFCLVNTDWAARR